MAPNPIVAAMVQNATLGAFSNILAQVITAYKNETEVSIDWVPVFQFVLFNLISTPPNFLWQDFLESTFPAYPQPPPPPKNVRVKPPPPNFSIRNTIIKFILDQTVGAILNTLLFSTFTHSIRLATIPTPRITSLPKAVTYWTSPGSVDFSRVNWGIVWDLSLDEFWAIFVAGWKLWPAVSVINFTLIKTVQGRNTVGALAGVIWGVYMSLISAQ